MEHTKKLKIKYLFTFSLLIGILLVIFGLNVGFGSVSIRINEVFQILLKQPSVDDIFYDIVWEIRLPRAIATVIGGAALAAAGLLLQIFFRNPIVEPYVLGVSSGATLFVALVTLGGFTLGFEQVSPFLLFIAALTGSAIVMFVVIAFASKVKSIVTLLVIGLMVGYMTGAATSILIAFADKERLQVFTLWTLGSFSGFTWQNVKILLMIGIPTLLAAMFIVKPLNAFLLGEEYAKSMGVRIKPFRIAIVMISSILAAVVTAFAGPVGFIGLAVPQIARLIFKASDNRILLPGTILLGGIVTALCDLIARIVLAPAELPISAVTALFGAPIVIILILRRRTSL